MEDFCKHCTDTRPNITYLAIGSAYSQYGGYQQHPPFLEKIIMNNPEFNVQIILIDPLIENPPEISNFFGLKKFDDSLYGKHNMNVNIVKEYFNFQELMSNTDINQNIPKQFMVSLINRTIMAVQENPFNTYLLFVHDFSGHNISKVSDHIFELYNNSDADIKDILKKNVLIDINNRIDAGCIVDMNSKFFHPLLIKKLSGALQIFNPFVLDDFELYTILLQKYKNNDIKLLTLHAINYKLNHFVNDILPIYRRIRMMLDNRPQGSPDPTEILNIRTHYLLSGIDIDPSSLCYPHKNYVIAQKTTLNLLNYLIFITGYLNFFKKGLIRNELFGDFIDLCNSSYISDPYKLIPIYRSCQKKLELFIHNLDPSEYVSELNNYCVEYTCIHKKLPFFMEILMQTDQQLVNTKDTSIIIEV